MGRKKKEKLEEVNKPYTLDKIDRLEFKTNGKIQEFIPSPYQQAIFDFIKHGHGNLVIEAAAGSGKSSTIVNAVKLIDEDKKILFIAFNKDIVKELKKKVGKLDNVDVKTLHSLGLLMVQRNFDGKKIMIEEFKYKSHIINNLNFYSKINLSSLKRREYYSYIENITKLVEFGRFNLAQSIKDMEMIIDKYGIELLADEAEIALSVMNWGKHNTDSVDYTDMIWLPNVLYLRPIGLQYDWVFLDEAQDASEAQKELLLKCSKMGTRFVFVGDKNQTIYGFSGSSPEIFEDFKSLPNTISLPLSISYRCPKNIVKFAQNLVPSIEYNTEDNREGIVVYNSKLEDVKDGDMVLCRNSAPLMKVYNDFIRMGRKCFVRGKDIGLNLKKMVENTNQKFLNQTLKSDGVFVRLYDSLFESRDNLMARSGLDYDTAMESALITNKIDTIKALEILSEGLTTSDELIERVKTMFSDKNMEGICLSTIHKAKGLEADNVYIVCRSLMPSKFAKQDWEKLQEHNLEYVAYTRAKNTLGFIDENDFNAFKYDDMSNISSLKFIETQTNRILGKETKHMLDEKTFAKEIIKYAKEIEKPKVVSKVLNDKPQLGRKVNNSFEIMFKNKLKK
jgi:superfamily I DNA/RNA helicase